MTTKEKREEIDLLLERGIIFYDYFYNKYGKMEIYKNAKEQIKKEHDEGNLKVLRHLSKDLDNWLREMPGEDAMELGRILKTKLGEDITKNEKLRLKLIQKILKRGKILDLDEYEMLSVRVEEIYDNSTLAKEVEKLNSLLAEYNK